MVSLFKTNSLLTALAGVLYCIFININLLEVDGLALRMNSGPLSDIFFSLLEWIGIQSSYGLFAIYILILIVQGFRFNKIFVRNKIFANRNYLAFMAYVTLMALFNNYTYISPAFLALTFIIPALDQLFDSARQDVSITHFFNTAFWIAMASLFYSPLVILLVFVFFGFAIISGFYWRYWLAAFISFFIPYFLAFTYYFSQDRTAFFWSSVNPFSSDSVAWPDSSINLWIQIGLIAFTIIFSFLLAGAKFFTGIIRIRKIYQVLTLFIPIVLLVFIFIKGISIDLVILILIPLSAYLAYSLGNLKGTLWSELVQLVFIASIVLIHFFNI